MHRALSVGLAAHNDTAVIILNRGGKDLRGGSAEAVDQHHDRAVVNHCGIVILLNIDIAEGVAHLHHRTFLDKEAGQVHRFVEVSPAIAA